MSQSESNPPVVVHVGTSGATNEHLRAKAPKWLKDAAAQAEESKRGNARSLVMQLSVANARKLAPWLEAEADRLAGREGASASDRRLARRLRTVAARAPKAIDRAENQAAASRRETESNAESADGSAA
jgi:hypothetical protein